MYKKDKQGMVIVLVALTILLASAIAFQWQGTIIAAAIGLTVVIVHILSQIHQRLLQLEQAAPSYFAQSAGIGMQRMVIYSAALLRFLPMQIHGCGWQVVRCWCLCSA